MAGRRSVALIDSGASQSYISPEIVTLCELQCSTTLIHLELADGSKVRSTQQTQAVPCIVGNRICQITFTVTKLLSNVDVVLGTDWLMRWNPVLKMPDFDRLFVVTTDASLVSVGAILSQDSDQGLQPVAYESRKLNPTETRYSAYERELLGIVWAIGKWRHCLEGKHFIFQTDHSFPEASP